MKKTTTTMKLNIEDEVIDKTEPLARLQDSEASEYMTESAMDISCCDIVEAEETSRNLRRQFRYRYSGRVVVYDDMLQGVSKGQAVDLNAKGVGLITTAKNLREAQTLVVEFLGCQNLPPFRAICEVMFVEDQPKTKTKKHVGLRFIKLSGLANRIATRYRGPLAA